MKLELRIDGVDQPIELQRNGPDCRFRLGDAPERAAHVETPELGMYSVLLDGLSYDTSVEETPTGVVVVADGHRFEIEVRDPRRWTRGSGGAGGHRGGDGVVRELQALTEMSYSLISERRRHAPASNSRAP